MASTVLFLALVFLICSTLLPSESHSSNEGFTISVVHRDSPQSPLYNQSMNLYESRIASVHRSILHAKRLSLLASSASATSQTNSLEISTNLIFEDGEYIASYYIGTPPTHVYAFLDTGSELIWTKGPPTFNPSISTTYKTLSCNSSSCELLGRRKTCRNGNEPCNYQIAYVDKSRSSGVFSRDKFSFDGTGHRLQEVGYIDFGSNNVSSSQFKGIQNGCLGLNRGKLSFINQLGIKKFSHCWDMQNSNESMLMYFGDKRAKIYPNDLTPIVEAKNPYYYVQLERISIDDNYVPNIPRGVFNITQSGGGFILDCGTAYTHLRKEAYEPFLRMMRKYVHKPLVKGPGQFELCYNGNSKDLDSIPQVTFHFAGAVEVKLIKEATFIEYARGVWCLAILRSPSSFGTVSIMGNFQMRNYWVGYDLQTKGVSLTYVERCPLKVS